MDPAALRDLRRAVAARARSSTSTATGTGSRATRSVPRRPTSATSARSSTRRASATRSASICARRRGAGRRRRRLGVMRGARPSTAGRQLRLALLRGRDAHAGLQRARPSARRSTPRTRRRRARRCTPTRTAAAAARSSPGPQYTATRYPASTGTAGSSATTSAAGCGTFEHRRRAGDERGRLRADGLRRRRPRAHAGGRSCLPPLHRGQRPDRPVGADRVRQPATARGGARHARGGSVAAARRLQRRRVARPRRRRGDLRVGLRRRQPRTPPAGPRATRTRTPASTRRG